MRWWLAGCIETIGLHKRLAKYQHAAPQDSGGLDDVTVGGAVAQAQCSYAHAAGVTAERVKRAPQRGHENFQSIIGDSSPDSPQRESAKRP